MQEKQVNLLDSTAGVPFYYNLELIQEGVKLTASAEMEMDWLQELYRNLYKELSGYGMKFCYNRQITNDSIQDLFVTIWDERSRFAHVINHKAYIFRIFRNILIKNLKVKNNELFNFNIEYSDISPEEIFIQQEREISLEKIISDGLDQLPPNQREIIQLHFYKSLSCKELSVLLGINIQSVRNLLSRSIRKLSGFVHEKADF